MFKLPPVFGNAAVRPPIISELMEAVKIQLPDEAREIAVSEILREDLGGQALGILDEEFGGNSC